MDVREKLVELLFKCAPQNTKAEWRGAKIEVCISQGKIADYLVAHGVTVQECAYWQYIEEDIDEDNNIQAYCSACGAGDKHATSMIGKVPYCWKCGRKMMPQPPKGE